MSARMEFADKRVLKGKDAVAERITVRGRPHPKATSDAVEFARHLRREARQAAAEKKVGR